MCLAIPGRIVELDRKNQSATVDYGSDTKRKVNVSLVTVQKGDYVLVHAGFAIQVLDEKDAKETLALFREMASLQEEER
jgi:hydrogenase expression/formation protein HypC